MLINKRNNLYEQQNKHRYDVPKNYKTTNLSKANKTASHHQSNRELNLAASRNDNAYESVCSPEDTHERTKLAQRHSLPHGSAVVSGNSNVNNASGGKQVKRSGSMKGNENKGKSIAGWKAFAVTYREASGGKPYFFMLPCCAQQSN